MVFRAHVRLCFLATGQIYNDVSGRLQIGRLEDLYWLLWQYTCGIIIKTDSWQVDPHISDLTYKLSSMASGRQQTLIVHCPLRKILHASSNPYGCCL